MYSPRLYKFRDSHVLYKPTVQTFGTVNWHTLFWYRHTHMTFPLPGKIMINWLDVKLILKLIDELFIV